MFKGVLDRVRAGAALLAPACPSFAVHVRSRGRTACTALAAR